MLVEQFAATLDTYATRFGSAPLVDTLEACHAVFVEGERQMFQDQAGPDGMPWVARKETVETHPLMNRSGSLLAAATGGEGHVVRYGSRELQTGVSKGAAGSLAGALIHQYGGTIRPRVKEFLSFRLNGRWVHAKQVTIPARPYIGMNAEHIARLYDVISDGVLAEVFNRG